MKYKFIILILIFVFIMTFFITQNQCLAKNIFTGHKEDKVFSVYDQNNDKYIFSIAMGLTVGDKYLSSDNIEYEIKNIEGNKAYAKKIGKVELVTEKDIEVTKSILKKAFAAEKRLIAIYHTHNDESYLPGAESESGHGEIHEVSQRLSDLLKKEGVDVINSDSIHSPHDGAAYERSRATALSLARKRPDAIFDIHRDAIPDKNEYLENVAGKTISQIRIVVGRQNPNRKANDSFARSLKAVSDELYPGLIRDIFYGGGSYNQQVNPRALLLEFGSHVTGKENALSSASIFSEILVQLLYGKKSNVSESSKITERKNTFRTIFIILTVFLTGLLGYLYISEGNIKGVKKRIKKYFNKEIVDRGGDND